MASPAFAADAPCGQEMKGAPCTYIYAWQDQQVPVVAFHCVHLDRPRVEKTTVVLATGSDGFKRLLEFQFPDDSGGHGPPTVR